jgi:hypothetical protein
MIRLTLTLAIAFELMATRGFSAEAASPAAFESLLARTSRQVEKFWDEFSAVTCLETIDQTKLGDDGKVLLKRRGAYDYLVLLQLSGDDLFVEESRVTQGKPPKESDRALLATSGFSTLVLIFHPHFQGSFTFADQGNDPEAPSLHRIHFEHVRGRRSPSVLQLRSREFPIEWQGTAWVQQTTGNITRIQAGLKASMEDVGLQKLDTDVHYALVSLRGQKELPWMPVAARIEADTKHQHWRNLHEFTSYRQFSVDADSKTQTPKEALNQ